MGLLGGMVFGNCLWYEDGGSGCVSFFYSVVDIGKDG